MTLRALVVGGTGGIGYGIACRLASEANSSVIISGRNKPSNIPHDNIEFRPLDASSMHAIKQYTDQYKLSPTPDQQKLDLLVMTQGILTTAGRTETPEGIDRKMALHFYGKQLLIRELAPVFKDDARVIIVLDGSRGSPDALNWDDLDLKTHYSISNAAGHCISMTDAMVQWHATHPGTAAAAARPFFVHAYPGFVGTGIFRGLPWYLRPVGQLASTLATSPDVCAENLVKGAAEAAAAVRREEDGNKQQFWAFIDAKGGLISNKPAWSEEQLDKVAAHTWKTVDDAIARGSS